MNKAYILPGIRESVEDPGYTEVTSKLKEKGYEIVPVIINWNRDNTVHDFIAEAKSQIDKDSKDDIFFSFSMGSYVSSILSIDYPDNTYIFCTISPFFAEDLDMIPQETVDFYGPNIFNSFKDFKSPANETKEAHFLIGDRDWEIAIERNKEIYDNWKGEKSFKLIEGAEHNISGKEYLSEILAVIKNSVS